MLLFLTFGAVSKKIKSKRTSYFSFYTELMPTDMFASKAMHAIFSSDFRSVYIPSKTNHCDFISVKL